MASASILFLAVVVLWAAMVLAKEDLEPRTHHQPHGGAGWQGGHPSGGGRHPPGGGAGWQQPLHHGGHYPSVGGAAWQQPSHHGGHYPRPCRYRCSLRSCDKFQCHYKCVRDVSCPALGELDARKGMGVEINVSKPLKEKVDAFVYVPM